MKCDEKLVRLEETYGDWVKQEKENCRLSSGAMTKELYRIRPRFLPIQVNKTMIKPCGKWGDGEPEYVRRSQTSQ